MREGWEAKKLSEVLKLKSGDGLTAKKMVKGPFPVYGGNGVAGYHNEFNHNSPQVIIGRVGALCGNARLIEVPFWLTDNAFKVSQGLEHFDEKFLVYLFNHLNLRQYARQAAQPVVSNSSLRDVLLVYPKSIGKQKQIVALLDKAFKAIDKAKANIEQNIINAKELFQSKLNAIFSQKGDGWEESTLGKICEFENGDRGKNYPSKKHYVSDGIPFITAANVNEGEISDDLNYITEERFRMLSRGKYHKGDFLFCLRGSLGKFGFVQNEGFGGIASSMVIVRVERGVINEYLYYYFLSGLCKAEIRKYQGGAAQPNLGAKDLQKFGINFPSLETQKEYAQLLKKSHCQVKKLENIYQKKLANLQELKKSILKKALSGELGS